MNKYFLLCVIIVLGMPTSHGWDRQAFNTAKRHVTNDNVNAVLGLVNSLNINQEGPQCHRTLLGIAALNGAGNVAKALLNLGANPNQRQSNNGYTPLMHAADRGDEEMYQLFMRNGGDKFVEDNSGRNSMKHAHDHGYDSVAAM